MAITLTYIRPGDMVIDATCGTGQDTVSLARAVGKTGKVFAFDIQKKALILTEARLHSHGIDNVHLLMRSFTEMSSHIPEGTASAVCFNLGYLPGGDHSITTTKDATIKGLCEALKVLKEGGIITVVLYDGHEEGRDEKKHVLEWAGSLDPKKYHTAYVNMLNQPNHPPEILWITKKRN